jgi:hypothetical protein
VHTGIPPFLSSFIFDRSFTTLNEIHISRSVSSESSGMLYVVEPSISSLRRINTKSGIVEAYSIAFMGGYRDGAISSALFLNQSVATFS